jgi:DNA-binding protein H-NS
MGDWISDLLIFSAGVSGGILIMLIEPLLTAARKQRTQLVETQARTPDEMKEQRDREILHEAFRTTEAIRGELDKTREMLHKTLITVLESADNQRNRQQNGADDLTEPSTPRRSTS